MDSVAVSCSPLGSTLALGPGQEPASGPTMDLRWRGGPVDPWRRVFLQTPPWAVSLHHFYRLACKSCITHIELALIGFTHQGDTSPHKEEQMFHLHHIMDILSLQFTFRNLFLLRTFIHLFFLLFSFSISKWDNTDFCETPKIGIRWFRLYPPLEKRMPCPPMT